MSDDDKPRHGRARPRPVPPTPVDEWDDADYDQANVLQRARHKRKVRRRKTKVRVAAMTRPRRVLRRSMIAGTWFLGLLAGLMITAIVLFYTLTDIPRPEDLPLPQVATIQYADGSTLAKIGNVDRTTVRLDQVPPSTRWAVLAAEDRSFYSDSAVSLRGTLRAALSDVSGGNRQGGSGITQQYVKNAYLSNAPTLTRKLKELMIAVKLSREYSKDQILEFYLNTVYFGRGAYGIQAAAQAFFGENVEKLTTAQGALLAGLLRAPSYYDPATDKQVSQARWHYVLAGMVQTKHLSAADEVAMKFPATKPIRGTGIGTTGWKYLIKNRVLAELAAHGINADEVAAKGLTIRTTIDKKAQSAALDAITTNFKGLTKKQQDLKNALVAIRPSDGGVLAYYGGSGPDVKGYDGKVDYNDHASDGARPPGSSFKPYTLATVLTQTIKQTEGKAHYTIQSQVDGSQCRKIEGTKICNDQSDGPYSGSQVSIAHAMKYSLNTTFDQLAVEAGPDQVAKTAHAVGIATKDSFGHRLLVNAKGVTDFGIGIGDYPVPVIDQADGFATLQNNGQHNDSYFVTKATSSDGEVVYSHQGKSTQAIDKRVANDVTLTLKPVAGVSGADLADGRKSAAKTGTEGIYKSQNNSDAWMVGYTPQVSAAVWVGTGLSKPIYNSDGSTMYGKDLPARTWKLFMDKYLAGAKKMPMATDQQISKDGSKPAPTPTYSYTYVPQPSSSPKASSSVKSTVPTLSAPPVTQLPSSTPAATPTPTPAPTTNCGGLLGPPCPPSPGG
ncbi:MAG: transglycosylase domain-containing protein [Jatrophihabitans sp.]